MERINQFTGKPLPDYATWGRSAHYSCDECGTGVICDCPVCGAPNCCPKCCDESRMEEQADQSTKKGRFGETGVISVRVPARDWQSRVSRGFTAPSGTHRSPSG